jgi:hypothetical protein
MMTGRACLMTTARSGERAVEQTISGSFIADQEVSLDPDARLRSE